MARTNIPVTAHSRFGQVTAATSGVRVAADATNEHVITHPGWGRPLFLVVENGSGGTITFTITAPAQPRTGNYARVLTCAVTGTVGVISVPPEYCQGDGTLQLDLDTDTSSYVSAFTISPSA